MARNTQYAEQALSANDTTFTTEELQNAGAGSFQQILSQLEAQSGIQQNLEVPQAEGVSPDGTRTLYVSSSGYATLFATAPQMLYVPEGLGARERPAGAVVDQVVLHSFGWRIDSAALRAGANSIQVDNRVTGHNPYKVYQRLQQVLASPRQSTSHIITRRGDIYCATPWNRGPAVNGGGQAQRLHMPERSISIELEEWHTGYNVQHGSVPEDQFRVLSKMPYTPEQLSALAFLLRKLGIWSNVNATTPLGFTFAEAQSKLGTGSGHVPGIVNMSVLDRNQLWSPGGEFELPATWKIGDAIPGHLDRALWEQRVEIYYSGLAVGTPISHHYTLQQVYAGLPTYALETELFAARETTLYTTRLPASGGVGAAAQAAANDRGAGFVRAQDMQQATRSGLYDAAPVSTDAVMIATAEYAGRMDKTASTQYAVPVVRNALAFDFAQGQWVLATTRIVAPGGD